MRALVIAALVAALPALACAAPRPRPVKIAGKASGAASAPQIQPLAGNASAAAVVVPLAGNATATGGAK